MPDEEVERWIDLTRGAVAYRITVEGKKTSPSAIVRLREPANNRPVTTYYDATNAQVGDHRRTKAGNLRLAAAAVSAATSAASSPTSTRSTRTSSSPICIGDVEQPVDRGAELRGHLLAAAIAGAALFVPTWCSSSTAGAALVVAAVIAGAALELAADLVAAAAISPSSWR